jgi:tripartite-type tricarboxylate transporter receptor subunit TctC
VLVVRKEAPFNSFQELVAHAKKNPGKVTIGTPGTGSAGDLSVQVINAQAGTEFLAVPYKGAAPAVTDALGGQVDGVILALGALSAHLKSGRFKALAISQPFPDLPQVPTLTKLGYKQDILGVWFAWMMPAGTPPEVAQALVPALQKATRDSTIAQRLQPLGILQDWEPAPRLVAEIRREFDTVAEVTSRLQPRKP